MPDGGKWGGKGGGGGGFGKGGKDGFGHGFGSMNFGGLERTGGGDPDNAISDTELFIGGLPFSCTE